MLTTPAASTLPASWEYLMPKKKERMAIYVRESDISLADSTTIESQAKACREYLSPRHFLETQDKAPLLMVPTQG